MANVRGCSVIDEIKITEESIKSCYDKVSQLEEKIKTQDISMEYKTIAEQELIEVKKLLVTNEQQLSKLHVQNVRSFAVAAAILFGSFLLYGIYVMFFTNI